MKVFRSEEGRRAVWESYDRLVAAWGVPTEERDLATSYGRTHAILAGDPTLPSLLLFHGVGDNSAMTWLHNASGLSRYFRLAAIDTMGGAGKSCPDERYTAGFDLARWLGDVLEALDLASTCAVGVSYGCYLVQLLHATFPDRVRRVVGFAGSVAVEGPRSAAFGQMLRMMRLFLPEGLIPTRASAVRLVRKMTGRNADRLVRDAELVEHFRLLLKHYSMQAQMVHRRRGLAPDEVDALRDKALFLIGDADRLAYTPASLRALDDATMRYRVIAGAGHAANVEMPDEVNAAIVDFCR